VLVVETMDVKHNDYPSIKDIDQNILKNRINRNISQRNQWKDMSYFFFLNLIITILFTVSIFPDEVVRKNGTVISNVKATIKRQTIRIEYENGRIEETSKKEFKAVRVRPIVWSSLLTSLTIEQKKIEEALEKERVAEASADGSDWEFRPEEEQISPWKNAALGLIPGYSGLYLTKNYWSAGIFTALETVALANFLDVANAQKTSPNIVEFHQAHNITGWILTSGIGGYFRSRATNSNSPMLASENLSYGFIPTYVLYNHTYKGYKGGLSGREISPIAVEGESNRLHAQEIQYASALLGGILIVDGILSYFSASAWNEGIYTGPKSQKPTTRLSRVSRSVFFPGWGQIYGGETIKGYSYLTVGLALIGNIILAESNVANTYRKYQDAPFILYPIYAVYAFQNNPVPAYGASNLLAKDKQEGLIEAVEKRNQAWTYFGVFWAWNLLDAAFLSGVNKIDNKIRITPNISYRNNLGVGNRLSLETYYTLNLTLEF